MRHTDATNLTTAGLVTSVLLFMIYTMTNLFSKVVHISNENSRLAESLDPGNASFYFVGVDLNVGKLGW